MLFSVLMGNCNNGKHLPEALNSVIDQTYKNWEIVIVDDKSSDESIEIINEFIKRGVNIDLSVNRSNLGVGGTKRKCCELATGEILGFLDPDDTIRKDALELMIRSHQDKPAASIIYSTLYYCDSQLNIRRKAEWIKPLSEGKTNLHENVISQFATFKKINYSRTTGIDATLLSAADKDLYYKLEETGKACFLDEALYYYRENENGVSQFKNKEGAISNHLKVLRSTIERRKVSGFNSLNRTDYRIRRSSLLMSKARLYTTKPSKLDLVVKYLFMSFLSWPLSKNKERIDLFYSALRNS